MRKPVTIDAVNRMIQLDVLANLREGGLSDDDRAQLDALVLELRDDVVLRDVVEARDYWRTRAEAAEAKNARPWTPLPKPALTVQVGGHYVGWANEIRYPDVGETEPMSGGMGVRSGVIELRGGWYVKTETRPGITEAVAQAEQAATLAPVHAPLGPWYRQSAWWWAIAAGVWITVELFSVAMR
jgi:hypothetical protein